MTTEAIMSATDMATNQPSPDSPMRKIRIAKITLNIGAGKNEDTLKKGLKLLQKLSTIKPTKTFTSKRIPGWGLRPGLSIGCKLTIRKDTTDLLKRLLVAKENTLSHKNFDNHGNFSFGIPEYIDIAGLEYDPELKIMGLEVAVTLERPGYRIKTRKVKSTRVGKKHQLTKDDALAFARNLGVEIQ
jgi:large subunit ribosomal protein L5